MLKYDDSNAINIKEFGEQLIGQTFFNVIQNADIAIEEKKEIITKVNNPRYKGGMGHLIEKYHFGYEINSEQEPDFPKVGMELKVTPYEIGKKGGYSAGERLVITMISYNNPVEDDFFTSHVYKKSKLTLLIHYLRNRSLPKIDYPIDYVTLFSPPEEDLKIIQQDYEKIITKVKEGRAHELSEGDTMYLGACTKGSTAAKSLMPQEYYAPYIKAPKRAFCFKQSYMTLMLNKYVLHKVNTYEKILDNSSELENQTFEKLITRKINAHTGKSAKALSEEFEVKYGPKSFYSSVAYRMLGVKSNQAEEFVKANIEVKAIRIEQDGSMRESISFPTFKFTELVEQDWEESSLYNTLSAKRFLFVVYKNNGDDYILTGCQLWNMPFSDFETVRQGWEEVRGIIEEGIIFNKKMRKNGIDFVIENNLPAKDANPIIHVRPHSAKRYYKIADGEEIGDNPIDGDVLPDGRMMTKQCFWLNNSYILSVLLPMLK